MVDETPREVEAEIVEPELTLNGEDDYLPDADLDKILQLVSDMPPQYKVKMGQVTAGAVQVELGFPYLGAVMQMEAMKQVFTASQVTGTLARNLKYERDKARRREGGDVDGT